MKCGIGLVSSSTRTEAGPHERRFEAGFSRLELAADLDWSHPTESRTIPNGSDLKCRLPVASLDRPEAVGWWQEGSVTRFGGGHSLRGVSLTKETCCPGKEG